MRGHVLSDFRHVLSTPFFDGLSPILINGRLIFPILFNLGRVSEFAVLGLSAVRGAEWMGG